MRTRRRRANIVKQTRAATRAVRLLCWPGKIKLHPLSNGHDVQATTPHWHTHVLRRDDANVREVPRILQRCAYLLELIATVYVQSVRNILQQDDCRAFRRYIPQEAANNPSAGVSQPFLFSLIKSCLGKASRPRTGRRLALASCLVLLRRCIRFAARGSPRAACASWRISRS